MRSQHPTGNTLAVLARVLLPYLGERRRVRARLARFGVARSSTQVTPRSEFSDAGVVATSPSLMHVQTRVARAQR